MGLLLRWSLYQAQVKARGQSGRLWDKSVAEPALSAAHAHHCDLMRAHGMCMYIYIYGSVSKPCTPGEHQNSWYMDVHPPKNGINRYWSIPIYIYAHTTYNFSMVKKCPKCQVRLPGWSLHRLHTFQWLQNHQVAEVGLNQDLWVRLILFWENYNDLTATSLRPHWNHG